MTFTNILLTLAGIYAIYFLHTLELKKKIFILATIGILAFVITIIKFESWQKDSQNERFENLYKSGKITTGKIIDKRFHRHSKTYTQRIIDYTFITESNIEINQEAYRTYPDQFEKLDEKLWRSNFSNAEKGEKYLVLYDSLNTEESLLVSDKKIIENNDLEKYRKEFEKNRKE